MFQTLKRKVRFLQLLAENAAQGRSTQGVVTTKISPDLEKNLGKIEADLGESSDLVIRRLTFGKRKLKGALVGIDGLVDNVRIVKILNALMLEDNTIEQDGELTPKTAIAALGNHLPVPETKITADLDNLLGEMLTGASAFMVDGTTEALVLSTRGWDKRAVAEPDTERLIRGPREGFIENLRTNTALIRRKLRSPNLRIETMRIGQRTQTDVAIVYIQGISPQKLVEEVKRRLERIKVDSILESGYIEEFIEDAPFSPFATVGNSERPDLVVAKMLEGNVAILTDGTPMVLTVPALFVESFKSPEDYYARPYYQTVVRWIRVIAYGFSVYLPGAYVALTTYHQELLPTPLLITMAAAREGTPFPAVVEALVMGIIFEILREAGLRMPRAAGQAVSIVGALVLGDAAVSAGLIGAPMVIIVALTAISSFVVPPQNDSGALLRLLVTAAAGVAGAYGVLIVTLGVLIHLSSLRSFGVPFFFPIAPFSRRDFAKDVVFRAPWWLMFTRPRFPGWIDPQRQEFRLMPHPPEEGKGENLGGE